MRSSKRNLGGKPGSRVYSGPDPASKSFGSGYSTVNSGGTMVVKDPFRTDSGVPGGKSGDDSGDSGGGSGGGSGGVPSIDGSDGGSGGVNFRSAAEDQGQANIAAALRAAKMNNPDFFGPFGSRTIEWKDGRPIITEQLTEDQQALLDLQERMGISRGELAQDIFPGVRDRLSQPFNVAGLPEISEGTMERDLVTDSMMARMQPFLDRQRTQQQNNLMVQGHNRGGSAWNAIQDDIARRENDARLAAVLAGGQEQNRLYNLEAANRERALRERMMERSQPLSEINALMAGTQPVIPEYQQFRGQGVEPAPLFDASVAGAGHQIALGNQDLTRQQMAMQDALARDQMAMQERIAQANMGAFNDASKREGLFDIIEAGADVFVEADPFGWWS